MRLAGAFIMMAAMVPSGTNAKPVSPVSVQTVIARIGALNGKVVRVKGYLGWCGAHNCELFADRTGHDRWYRDLQATTRRQEVLRDRIPRLGISTPAGFAAKADRFQHSTVVITGEVTSMCRFHGEPACTDGATDLFPTDIIPSKEP